MRIAICLATVLFTTPLLAADDAASLAARLAELRENGSAQIRLRLEARGAAEKTNLQILIKERSTKAGSDLSYQVLWPKDRKGEAVVLRRTAQATTGFHFTPPDKTEKIDGGDLGKSLLGTDLSYEDVISNYFEWPQQAIVGTEKVDGADCQILESKPGKGTHSIYGSVKSWIDTRRMVPLRIDKLSPSGQVIRRFDTTRVVTSDGKHIPSNMTVQGPGGGSSTVVDGSKIRRDVTFSEKDFSAEGVKELPGAPAE